jgi:hypothetical protein
MTKRLNVKVLGLIENMSYMTCPNCDEKIRVFESDDIDSFLEDQDIELLAELPINGAVTQKNRLSEEIITIFDDVANKVKDKIRNKINQPS